MSSPTEVADRLIAEAARDDAAAFDAQYELARRGERAVAAMRAEGVVRARQWAEDDRRADADRRFDPEPEEPVPPPRPGPPAPARRPTRPDGTTNDEDDEVPTRWLR